MSEAVGNRLHVHDVVMTRRERERSEIKRLMTGKKERETFLVVVGAGNEHAILNFTKRKSCNLITRRRTNADLGDRI